MLKDLPRLLLRGLFTLLFRLRVEGQLDGLNSRRLLIIANHESFLDGLLLGVALPLNPVFVVHTGVTRNWFFRWVLSLVDYLAVDPTNPMAMKSIVNLVESGRPVVIFPEGRITNTGSLMKVYDGPAFIAAKTGADLLPVRLDGPARSWFARTSGRYPRQLLPRITLTLLPITHIAMPQTGSAKQRRRQAGEALRRVMQERGRHSIGAGRALAVQNLWENLAMLSFVGIYALLEGVAVIPVAMGYGVLVLLGIAVLAWRRWQSPVAT